ncbi:transcriptional regulator [Corynebacterium sp. sy017]|uniref:winged helix-turn-helix transcriptional regulator n=1 Tax=unclassified Corynebacterium TaxID=2624378 RepID=UPI0011864927|nr:MULTISPECIES: helix-turn-helix domain-containing protein [unclassified Corynebacterium]MBP3088396.1 transcriptional regulator [Corynebacterium sp. sy017]QDZ41838.1 helix-turn-helix transcriptional regulator [Corynebacterium sp. sy039]TSD91710.1 transcriptional regulator [Corynebacterium sp. SY003]
MSKGNHENPSLTQCPIARTVAIIGEKWSLLILRDLARGMNKFSEIQQSLGCPKNLLSTRLKTFERAGIIARNEYREAGARARQAYYLTESGKALIPVLLALQDWGEEYLLP